MTALFSILIVVVAVLLVIVILVQNPKGGGLSSAFGGDSPQMLGGVQKTTDFLDKATWSLVIAMFVLVIAMNMFGADTIEESADTQLIEQVEEAVPFTAPAVPATGTEAASGSESLDNMPEPVQE